MWLGRPIFTPCRLSIAPAFSGGHDLVPDEVAAERPAALPVAGSSAMPTSGREHPAVDRRLVGAALASRTETRRSRRAGSRCEQLVVRRGSSAALSTARRVASGRTETARRTRRPAPAGRCRPPPSAGSPSAAAAPRASAIGSPKVGSGCVIQAKLRSSPLHVERHRRRPDAEAEHERARGRARARRRAPARTRCRSSDARPSAARRPA